jgi:hypothetical protein
MYRIAMLCTIIIIIITTTTVVCVFGIAAQQNRASGYLLSQRMPHNESSSH